MVKNMDLGGSHGGSQAEEMFLLVTVRGLLAAWPVESGLNSSVFELVMTPASSLVPWRGKPFSVEGSSACLLHGARIWFRDPG